MGIPNTSIQALKPNVTQEDALRTFSSARPATLYWRVVRGPLQRIATAYVPYRLYRTTYRLRSQEHATLFALDAVDGSLDLFTFAQAPNASQLVNLHSRNHLTPLLDAPRADALLRDKVLRAIFQQGFFRLRDLNLQLSSEPTLFYIPYWLGFYGRDSLRCRVLDGVRRRIEGAKASAFFEHWLAA